ncbi:hypothetical protein [Algivirga pacifica]|uniref:Uncharacterized protein n=1 Tax=Algivirga pacifica TaxID=1162670 RepID=A0ABP9D821_9BACT
MIGALIQKMKRSYLSIFLVIGLLLGSCQNELLIHLDDSRQSETAWGAIAVQGRMTLTPEEKAATSNFRTTPPVPEEIMRNVEVNGSLSIYDLNFNLATQVNTIATFGQLSNLSLHLPQGTYYVMSSGFDGYQMEVKTYENTAHKDTWTLTFTPEGAAGYVWWNRTFDSPYRIAFRIHDVLFLEGDLGKHIPLGEGKIEMGYINKHGKFIPTDKISNKKVFEKGIIYALDLSSFPIVMDAQGRPRLEKNKQPRIMEYQLP